MSGGRLGVQCAPGPSVPRDSFAANGAGRRHIWVCPSLDLVVAQSPGLCKNQTYELNLARMERHATACA